MKFAKEIVLNPLFNEEIRRTRDLVLSSFFEFGIKRS